MSYRLLKHRHTETELASVQEEIESSAAGADLRKLLTRKQDLRKLLAELGP